MYSIRTYYFLYVSMAGVRFVHAASLLPLAYSVRLSQSERCYVSYVDERVVESICLGLRVSL